MKSKQTDIFKSNKIFAWIAAGTVVILLVPLSFVLFDIRIPDPGSPGLEKFGWSFFDFITMGALMFGAGSVFVYATRITKVNRVVLAAATLLALFLIWIELAVDGVSQLLTFIFN